MSFAKALRNSRFIGTRRFYAGVLAIAVPIMVQNAITNFVSLLDNLMVGAVGTEQMSGVSIVNQLMFVVNLCLFGGMSGAGIFTAQFFGQHNHEGVRSTFRFKLMLAVGITVIGTGVLLSFGTPLINAYLHDGSETGDLAATLLYGQKYLAIMLWGLAPFALQQVYSSTLRETGRTLPPMVAGIIAIIVNCVLNYILIFGKFGAPELGVEGAAYATVISRYIETAIIILWTHKNKALNVFINGAYKSMRIPKTLLLRIIRRDSPLLFNELLWSMGIAILTQCYSMRGLSVIAALNITSTISNLFNVVYLSLGNSIAIIVGQLLGADKFDEARDTAYKIITFSVLVCFVIGAALALMAPLFPMAYRTTDEVRSLATSLIRVASCLMPMHAYLHSSYFTIRSGGKTVITFLFDCAFMWVVSIPLAYVLSRFTALPILPVYIIVQGADALKCVIGYILLKKGVWIHNIVHEAA